jgi:hypothetical protein
MPDEDQTKGRRNWRGETLYEHDARDGHAVFRVKGEGRLRRIGRGLREVGLTTKAYVLGVVGGAVAVSLLWLMTHGDIRKAVDWFNPHEPPDVEETVPSPLHKKPLESATPTQPLQPIQDTRVGEEPIQPNTSTTEPVKPGFRIRFPSRLDTEHKEETLHTQDGRGKGSMDIMDLPPPNSKQRRLQRNR